MGNIPKIKKSVLNYSLIIFLIWSSIIIFSAYWNIQLEKRITLDTVKSIARSNFNKDQAYRQWATSHGGVYVTPTEKTPPSPWLAHIKDRDVVTTDGKKLTLMNPAYMLREMMSDYSDLYGIKGRIVGIVYLNKNNKADKWEANAIRKFEKNVKEVMEITKVDGEEYLRLMRPMIMNQKCQKCHGHLGFPNGSVRGGVSVSVPLKKFKDNEKASINSTLTTHLIIWLLGTIAIIVLARSIIIHLSKRESDLEQIVISSEVFNNTLDAIFITDTKGEIQRVNKAFIELTGYKEDEIIGKNSRILKSNYHDNEFYKNLWETIIEKGFIQVEIWNRTKDGEVFVSIESISSVKDENGKNKFFVATLHDITARKDAEERITHMAHYDPLTDLPNRVLFQDRLLHAINMADRNKTKVILAFIDLDGFKNVNDTKGHQVGDKLLKVVSDKLKNTVRKYDTVSRLGGDEFTIIFENIRSIDNILPVLSRALNEVKNEIVIDDKSIFITASIGLSVYPDDGEDVHLLLQHADTAMYKAKELGKNRFCFYEESMTLSAQRKVDIEVSLLTALKNKEFKVYYQPKVLASSGKVIAAEALIRWFSTQKGFIPPNEFIPIAEEMHIVDKIDLYVLDEVCKDMKIWHDLGYKDIKIAINLSGYDISEKDLFKNIKSIVEKHKISASNLEFEITETYFVNFAKENLDTLNRLRDYGFVLSIDDFGTGYSSLSNLRQLPVDILKIDQSFIRTLDTNKDNMDIVNMIIDLARTFKLKVIAEGVETKEQLEYLQKRRCDYIQGYLESKPLPKDEFKEYLIKKSKK